LRLFSFGGYGLALAALALMVFGAIECPPKIILAKVTVNVMYLGVAGMRSSSKDDFLGLALQFYT